MRRKRLTQIFPWLLPFRVRQRRLFLYGKMRLDKNRYAALKEDNPLPYTLFETSCPLYNPDTGFDMVYQENKVFNLKLAAATLNRVVIRPNEVFSFWWLVRRADKDTPYKEGLTVIDGRLQTIRGGGMCQMSNLLFWMFLHAPLTVVERHGHDVKDFPEPKSDAPMGVDATVAEGWRDLLVKNETMATYQLCIEFDEAHITGRLLTDLSPRQQYEVVNGAPQYTRENHKVYEEVDVLQRSVSLATGACLREKLLYRNKCEIGYQLPLDTVIEEKGSTL